MNYWLCFDERALKEFKGLVESIREQFKKKLEKVLLNPAFFKIVVAQSCFKQPLFAPARVSRAAPDLASRHR